MSNTGWQRNLGTSKREQGIVTPKAPRRRKCGCWYREGKPFTFCYGHKIIWDRLKVLHSALPIRGPRP